MISKSKISLFILLTFLFGGCASNPNLYQPKTEEHITVARAQQLKKGMSTDQVIEIMGSPNILETDKDGNEVWIYDKISTQSASSSSGVQTGLIPGLLIVGGSSGASSASSQRTLTVIVKFNHNKRVKEIAYHTSRF
jgi:outer membrane protein assembly factor BamE (lipoprotein component of BamABCDE complex)